LADIAAAGRGAREVRAWDWPTRAFHWSLVFCIVNAWASIQFAARVGDNMLIWHRWNGYAILVLIVFRVLWGFVGSSTARFKAFIRWPWHAAGYALDLLRGRSRSFLGHNPLGAWMIVALLVAVAGQAIGGLYTMDHNEIIAGPLKRTIDHDLALLIGKWHVWFFNVIVALVCVHILANAFYGTFKGEPLILAMMSGRKPRHVYEDQQELVSPANVGARAALCLLAAVVIVFGGIVALGGRIL
jgi:cytochrome b